MDETLRQEVERAIREKLHVTGRYRTPLGSASFEYPIAIDGDSIVLRDGDCGLARPTVTITVDEWRDLVQRGLYRRVGFWDFAPADDPAADEIAFCHRHPQSAGRELHRLRQRLAEIEGAGR